MSVGTIDRDRPREGTIGVDRRQSRLHLLQEGRCMGEVPVHARQDALMRIAEAVEAQHQCPGFGSYVLR